MKEREKMTQYENAVKKFNNDVEERLNLKKQYFGEDLWKQVVKHLDCRIYWVKEYYIFDEKECAFRAKNGKTKIVSIQKDLSLFYAKESLDIFKDGYWEPEREKRCGLYLIGNTVFNPITNQKFYWIKIGLTTNSITRFSSYNTDNPMYFYIDFLPIKDRKQVKHYETIYQDELKGKVVACCERNNEWFLVDEETYFKICEEKFNYFF